MSPAEDASEWLPAERAALGLTQRELGELLDVEANTIARWERGERLVQHPKMLQLALAALARDRRRRTRRA